MDTTARRISYVFLCALPFLDLAVVGVRALRVPIFYTVVGCVLFAGIVLAAWTVGARVIVTGSPNRRLALAGALLIAPWAVISLLWVGLGAPFQATTSENYMRYLVLLGSSLLVASGFVVLNAELHDGGERFYSTAGFAAAIPSAMGYFVAVSMSAGQTLARLGQDTSPAPALLAHMYSVVEFVAVASTYVATAAFAAALGNIGWITTGASRVYVIANLVLLLLVMVRGVSYPELSSTTAPWYTRPGFIAGIPAIPWIMSGLLGVLLLRRAGKEDAHETSTG